jgi:hypothetical protein
MNSKVAYQVPQDDGFPPIGVELLNAVEVEEGLYRIQNAPFFAQEVAYGDVVRATPSSVPGQLDFAELVEASPFTSLSIILLTNDMDTFLMDFFRGQQCVIEYGEFGGLRVLAVGVPPAANYAAIRQQLGILEAAEKLSFSELALGRPEALS